MSSNNSVAKAKIICVTKPNEEQIRGLKDFVCKKTGADECELEIVFDESIIGGFIIEIGGEQYDRSFKSKLGEIKSRVSLDAQQYNAANANEIISIIREDVEKIEFDASSEEIGTVISARDGIATISGLDSVMYGEIIVFESGIRGMVQDIKEHTVGCILFALIVDSI